VLETVRTFAVVFAVTFSEPATPLAGANVNAVTFAVVVALIRNAVPLVTACTTEPAGIPVPEILCPTVMPAVLETVNVFCPEVFVTPDETEDELPGVKPAFESTHVPNPTFCTEVAKPLFPIMFATSFSNALAPPNTNVRAVATFATKGELITTAVGTVPA
jgi:hypothetical protein